MVLKSIVRIPEQVTCDDLYAARIPFNSRILAISTWFTNAMIMRSTCVQCVWVGAVALLLTGSTCLAADEAGSAANTSSYFIRPAELDADVRFWQRVYTEAGTDGGFIHDDAHLEVVYEQLTLAADLSPRARSKRVDDAKAKYATILRKLANIPAGTVVELTAEENRVRNLWPKSASRDTLLLAARSVRFQLGQANRFKEGLPQLGTNAARG